MNRLDWLLVYLLLESLILRLLLRITLLHGLLLGIALLHGLLLGIALLHGLLLGIALLHGLLLGIALLHGLLHGLRGHIILLNNRLATNNTEFCAVLKVRATVVTVHFDLILFVAGGSAAGLDKMLAGTIKKE